MIWKGSWTFFLLVNCGKCYLLLIRSALHDITKLKYYGYKDSFLNWLFFLKSKKRICLPIIFHLCFLMEHNGGVLLNLVDTVVVFLKLYIGFWWPHMKRTTVWTDTGHKLLPSNIEYISACSTENAQLLDLSKIVNFIKIGWHERYCNGM